MRKVYSGLVSVVIALLACACGAEPGDRSGQSGASKKMPVGPVERLTPESGGEFVLIGAGEFIMGNDAGRSDEKPARRVNISAFYMETTPVTQALFEKAMGNNPSKWKNPDAPVEQLRWREAAEFCNRASVIDGLAPCYDPATWACNFDADGYRLPTEAEWEYAARAGTKTKYFFGDAEALLDSFAWYKKNSGGRTRPVAKKRPNGWGLFDMAGNVWEWCNDFYAQDYYRDAPAQDPTGPEESQWRVLRGGAFDSNEQRCLVSYRFKEIPSYGDACEGYDSYGFRRVRRVPTSN